MKEMLNSSNYTLVTYLSDIKQKCIPCRFSIVFSQDSHLPPLFWSDLRNPLPLNRIQYFNIVLTQ